MGTFERYLSVWVALAIGGGLALGLVVPQFFAIVATLEIAHVNLVACQTVHHGGSCGAVFRNYL